MGPVAPIPGSRFQFLVQGLCQAGTLETTCITYTSVLYETIRVTSFKMD
jgi:hypothetical protein